MLPVFTLRLLRTNLWVHGISPKKNALRVSCDILPSSSISRFSDPRTMLLGAIYDELESCRNRVCMKPRQDFEFRDAQHLRHFKPARAASQF